ncbi:MAG: Holliday junction branch migration protein RuvA [Chloroflexi bacterium]|nr:Holliday junction branch migration protein RuvA [Chloroflexota bacterium]
MIGWLQGRVLAQEAERLLVQVGSLGLWVQVPQPLAQQTRPGDEVALHTHLVVRADALALYGFAEAAERDLFVALLGVNGVGARLALALLSFLSPEAIRRAVAQEQPAVLQRVPGVGKKTAQRIVLALHDRLAAEVLPGQAALSDLDAEVLDALVALGYSVVEAQTAIQHIPRDAPADLETRLRLALQYFAR